MKKVLFATGNESKAKRFLNSLNKQGFEVFTLNDIDASVDVNENGKNAVENAIIKAKAYANIVNMPVIAMDDTLFLEGVPEDVQPKTFVRRINGKRLNDQELLNYYIDLVKKYGKDNKILGCWIYGMAIINNNEIFTYEWSKNNFYMVSTPSKQINPGYPLNSITIDPTLNKYYSELSLEEKNVVDDSDVIKFILDHIN